MTWKHKLGWKRDTPRDEAPPDKKKSTYDPDSVTDSQASRMEGEGQGQQQGDTRLTIGRLPGSVAIDAQLPSTMPRAEDDIITRAGSHEFHDHAGSGSDTARRRRFFESRL